jgi:hypothetical protein
MKGYIPNIGLCIWGSFDLLDPSILTMALIAKCHRNIYAEFAGNFLNSGGTTSEIKMPMHKQSNINFKRVPNDIIHPYL